MGGVGLTEVVGRLRLKERRVARRRAAVQKSTQAMVEPVGQKGIAVGGKGSERILAV